MRVGLQDTPTPVCREEAMPVQDSRPEPRRPTPAGLSLATVDLSRDRELILGWMRETVLVSYGEAGLAYFSQHADLTRIVEEGAAAFPESFVMAWMARNPDGDKTNASPAAPSPAGMLLMDIRPASHEGHSDIEGNLGNTGDIGYIDVLYVASRYRGQGVADVLQRRAVSVCAERGVQHIELHVGANNARAIRFYERMGYGRAGQTTVAGQPALAMRFTIQAD